MHIISIQDGHGLLQNDWPMIQMLIDKMHRAARHLHPVFQRLSLRVHAGESGQQRRVNIDDAIGKSPYEVRRQKTHIPRKANQINLRMLKRRYYLGIVLFPDPTFGRNHLSAQATPL
ncbi:MAG: hypothetical protein JWN42_2773, partial [Candidatus Angelobacter sp.]|nr:hypothetical protein [Candidatus Angelobacter sp.]